MQRRGGYYPPGIIKKQIYKKEAFIMGKNYEINFTQGKLLPLLIRFAIPVMLSGMLQLIFHTADIVVVGRFAGEDSLAAVGSTGSMINLLVGIFMGLSIGTNVLISKNYGSGDEKGMHRSVHTSIITAAIGGVLFGIIGFVLCRPTLILMGTPADVLEKATLYVKIYFAGLPALSLFNFGSAILRAVGDTRRPLFALTLSGVINLILNLFCVIVLHMDVVGVAIATVASEIVSAIYILFCLIQTDRPYRLQVNRLRIYKRELIQLLQIGFPSGVQSSLFAIGNTTIQTTVNSFGTLAVAGASAASSLDAFIYQALTAFHATALTATAQNLSMKKFDRIRETIKKCILLSVVIGVPLCAFLVIFSKRLLGIYTTSPEAIVFGMRRMFVITSFYFIVGAMEILSGVLRGMSHSSLPTMTSLVGTCAFRVFWIFCIFPIFRQWEVIFLAFPISWILTTIANYICVRVLLPRLQKQIS